MTHSNARQRAVAYYRSNVSESSIRQQRDGVRQWAEAHGLIIIREFVDRADQPDSLPRRPAFQELLRWIRQSDDFRYILCDELTRFTRLADLDLLRQYGTLCEQHHKHLIFTTTASPHAQPFSTRGNASSAG